MDGTRRTPAIWFTSLASLAGCLYLFANLDSKSMILFFIWAAIGLVVYYTYSRSRSHVGKGLVEVHEDDADAPPQPVPPLPGA